MWSNQYIISISQYTRDNKILNAAFNINRFNLNVCHMSEPFVDTSHCCISNPAALCICTFFETSCWNTRKSIDSFYFSCLQVCSRWHGRPLSVSLSLSIEKNCNTKQQEVSGWFLFFPCFHGLCVVSSHIPKIYAKEGGGGDSTLVHYMRMWASRPVLGTFLSSSFITKWVNKMTPLWWKPNKPLLFSSTKCLCAPFY